MKSTSLVPSSVSVSNTATQSAQFVAGVMFGNYLEIQARKLLRRVSTTFTVPGWLISTMMTILTGYGASITRDGLRTFLMGNTAIHVVWTAGYVKTMVIDKHFDASSPTYDHLTAMIPDVGGDYAIQDLTSTADNAEPEEGVGGIGNVIDRGRSRLRQMFGRQNPGETIFIDRPQAAEIGPSENQLFGAEEGHEEDASHIPATGGSPLF